MGIENVRNEELVFTAIGIFMQHCHGSGARSHGYWRLFLVHCVPFMVDVIT